MKTMSKTLHILIIKQSEWWVAQCLEYDLAAQARTLKDVQYEFQRIFFGRLLVARELDIDPFEAIPSAPSYYDSIYRDTNKTIKLELKPMENPPTDISPHYLLPPEALVYEY